MLTDIAYLVSFNAFFCALGVLQLWRARRSLARKKLCLRCGYDTRASPARCPECGLAPPRLDTRDLEVRVRILRATSGVFFAIPLIMDLSFVADLLAFQ